MAMRWFVLLAVMILGAGCPSASELPASGSQSSDALYPVSQSETMDDEPDSSAWSDFIDSLIEIEVIVYGSGDVQINEWVTVTRNRTQYVNENERLTVSGIPEDGHYLAYWNGPYSLAAPFPTFECNASRDMQIIAVFLPDNADPYMPTTDLSDSFVELYIVNASPFTLEGNVSMGQDVRNREISVGPGSNHRFVDNCGSRVTFGLPGGIKAIVMDGSSLYYELSAKEMVRGVDHNCGETITMMFTYDEDLEDLFFGSFSIETK